MQARTEGMKVQDQARKDEELIEEYLGAFIEEEIRKYLSGPEPLTREKIVAGISKSRPVRAFIRRHPAFEKLEDKVRVYLETKAGMVEPAPAKAAASVYAGPVPLFSPVKPAPAAIVSISILADSFMLLDLLKAKAGKAENHPEEDSPWIGDGEEQAELYNLTHFAHVKLADTSLSRERFQAAAELAACIIRRERENYKRVINMDAFVNGDCLTVSGKHSAVTSCEYSNRQKTLPAPITWVPLDNMKEAAARYLDESFQVWDSAWNFAPDRILIQLRSGQEVWEMRERVYFLEASCKKIDGNFSLEMNNAENRDAPPNSLSVSKTQLEKARAVLLGETNACDNALAGRPLKFTRI